MRKEERWSNSSRVEDGNGRLAQGENEVRRIWKESFEDLYNIYSETGCSPRVWL